MPGASLPLASVLVQAVPPVRRRRLGCSTATEPSAHRTILP